MISPQCFIKEEKDAEYGAPLYFLVGPGFKPFKPWVETGWRTKPFWAFSPEKKVPALVGSATISVVESAYFRWGLGALRKF